MSKSKAFDKIRVEGSINLGDCRDLKQTLGAVERSDRHMLASRRSAIRHDPRRPDDSGIGRALEFSLAEAPGTLDISGRGLTTSFGVFGAPGCGKTVLLMHLLRQLLEHERDRPDHRYGALILDPKAALISDVQELCEETGRLDDLRIINTEYLNREGVSPLNIIDCHIEPYELGPVLVLAGRSAGIDASDPFWFQEWSNIFASGLAVLKLYNELHTQLDGPARVTLRQLVEAVSDEVPADPARGWQAERRILRIAREVHELRGEFTASQRKNLAIDLQQIERFYRQDYVGTIDAFITRAFGMFRRPHLACYSDASPRPGQPPFYEDIIEHGRICLVSASPSEPGLAKTLCTLSKCLFQRTVLARGDLLARGMLDNNTRPLLIACDEYSEIASEMPGQSMGDGQFLALARQFGCMALLATQSVNVLEASSLKESWRSVFSNFAAKIYMRVADNETAEEATKLAGESDWQLRSRSRQHGGGGASTGRQDELRERSNLPSSVLTQVLKVGEAVAIGSLDGGDSVPGTFFFKVPYKEKQKKPSASVRTGLRQRPVGA